MRNARTPALAGISALFAMALIGPLPAQAQDAGAQERPAPGPAYSFESQHYSMQDVGELLQRLGQEMLNDEQVTVGGNTYPLSGFGEIEFYLNQRGARTGVGVEFSSDGRTSPPASRRKQDYDPYERGGRWWTPTDVADLMLDLSETLASTGAFVMEDHRVGFRGAASIDVRLIEDIRGRGIPYRLEVHVLFGDGEFSGPDDDEDYREDQQHGLIRSLARAQQDGADASEVAGVFATIAEDLRAGRVRLEDEDISVGETVRFGLSHVTAIDGRYDKIEFSLGFGPVPERQVTPRYGDEAFNEPTADLAALLQRISSQILEDGTFELGGEVFTVSRTSSWEIGASPGGFSLEVGYHQPGRP